MKERPILFSGEMVRAILDGRKTQTRRVVATDLRPQSEDTFMCGLPENPQNVRMCGPYAKCDAPAGSHSVSYRIYCPYGVVGSRLWCIQIRPIPFGEGKYGVGDDGNLYDISGPEPTRRKTRLSHNGYEEITLRYKGDSSHFRINRLVCEAFYGQPPDNMPICRHIDGDRRNNLPENLDWGTSSQNSSDAAATGAWRGERNASARLSNTDVETIRVSSTPQSILAAQYGVTQPTISKIKRGRRWSVPPACPPRNFTAWASRITLEITDIRVERLQEISEEDARAEGIRELLYEASNGNTTCYSAYTAREMFNGADGTMHTTARVAFAALWDSINGKRGHSVGESNPWVWAITFKRVESEVGR